MSEEMNEVETTTVDTTQDYIDAIKSVKANSVSREEYDKIRDENKKLLESLVNGNPLQQTQEEKPKRTIDDIRKQLFNHEHNNLEYCTLALELRDRVLEEEGKDIFVANNNLYTAGNDSYEAAGRVADVMKECIEYASGDSAAFTAELMRRTNDVSLPRNR